MKAFLMHRGRNFDVHADLPTNLADLLQDLELETLVRTMSAEDDFLAKITRSALLQASRSDVETVLYRQAVLKDCLQNPVAVRALYSISIEALEAERKNSWAYMSNYPAGILRRSLDVLHQLVELLSKLRGISDSFSSRFHSEGMTDLFATLRHEMSDDYFLRIHAHLRDLRFQNGVLIGAGLGKGNRGRNYILLRSNELPPSWFQRFFGPRKPGYTFTLHPRDEGGARALSELNDRGISLVANALAQSTDHIVSFFVMLRHELAFYVGCLNLHERLHGMTTSFPVPAHSSQRLYEYVGLYDACLGLAMDSMPVANDGKLDGRGLVLVTGANQGGKSTFLRSVGIAQVMMQAGMFVPAKFLSASLCEGLFTHFKREEDTDMRSGKFDEELTRMSGLIDEMHPNALCLFNESFASTNEIEGSEIAMQIAKGLLAKDIRIVFVTHMYELANTFFRTQDLQVAFLRAERRADGSRSFKVIPGEPLRTSYGRDLYDEVFAKDVQSGILRTSPDETTCV